MPLVRICKELFEELDKIRNRRINEAMKITGLPRGMIDGLTIKNVSYIECSKEYWLKHRKL